MPVTVRRLYRIRDGAWMGGVCTGLGVYLEIDPVVVRLVWSLVTVFTGFVFGIVGYLLAWLVIPETPSGS